MSFPQKSDHENSTKFCEQMAGTEWPPEVDEHWTAGWVDRQQQNYEQIRVFQQQILWKVPINFAEM